MELLRAETRADKRDLIKKAKKKAEFAKKLTPLQQEYINDVVEAGKDYARIVLMNCFDVSVQGALIECTDLKYKDIEKVVTRCGELIRECKEVLETMNTEERIMSVKKIENEVAKKIANMIFEGIERKDIVKKIRAEYKGTGLTTSEINIYYKKGLESYEKFMAEQEGLKKAIEISEAVKENDVEKAVNYIFNDKKEVKHSKGNKNDKKNDKPVESVEVKEVSKFKVSNKVVKIISCDVTGEHGEYEINGGVLAIKGSDDAFVNIPAVQNWASDKREELLKEIERLNSLENEAIEVIKEFMA